MPEYYPPIWLIVGILLLLPASVWILARTQDIILLRAIIQDLCLSFNRRECARYHHDKRFNPVAIYEYAQKYVPSYWAMLLSRRPLTPMEWLPDHLRDLLVPN